jgi:hypothetical protein
VNVPDGLGHVQRALPQTTVVRAKDEALTGAGYGCIGANYLSCTITYVVFMKNRFGVLPCVCVMAALTLILPSAQAQEMSFSLIEQLVIGDDEEAPAEYLFTVPELVRTDSKGYIYVHDRGRTDVRVFDESGKYVTTVGMRGEGPGEMREIVSMHVDDRDRLIVADRDSRRLTVFKNTSISYLILELILGRV